MTADTTFRLKGKVAGTDIATLSDRDRLLTPTLIFLEAGDIRLEPREEGVYEATGTPLNDSLLLLNRKLEALRNEYRPLRTRKSKPSSHALRRFPAR